MLKTILSSITGFISPFLLYIVAGLFVIASLSIGYNVYLRSQIKSLNLEKQLIETKYEKAQEENKKEQLQSVIQNVEEIKEEQKVETKKFTEIKKTSKVIESNINKVDVKQIPSINSSLDKLLDCFDFQTGATESVSPDNNLCTRRNKS